MNTVLKLFRKKGNSIDDFVTKYKEVVAQKSELILQNDAAKIELLRGGDQKKISERLRSNQLEIELADVACEEIKSQLAALLSKEVEDNYARLPTEKAKYERELEKNTAEAGQTLGRCVSVLRSINSPSANAIIKAINAAMTEVRAKHGEKMRGFDAGYTTGGSTGAGLRDLQAEKKRLDAVDRREPGTEGTQIVIKKRVNGLLGIIPEKKPEIPVKLPGIFGVGQRYL